MNENIIALRPDYGFPSALMSELLKKGRHYNITEVIPFSPSDIMVAQWVNLKCRYGCSKYGSSWCCPPATPALDKVEALLSEYSLAVLLVGTHQYESFYRDNHQKRIQQVRSWKGTLSLERFLFLKGYYKAFSLIGEACALCKECAYPDECRFPRERRPSLEALSIDVIGTVKRLGRSPQIAQHFCETYSYYAIILVE
jgi:5-hydroxybenzimidazole methyltransferase